MESMEKTHLCMLLYISLAGGKGMHSRSGASWVILTSAVTTTLSRSSRGFLRCFMDSKKVRMYFQSSLLSRTLLDTDHQIWTSLQ